MADGTRLRSMEDFMRRTETQFVEIQKFMEGSQQLHDEHRKALADQSAKTDNQFLRITEMLRSLMEKDRSPSVPVELENSKKQQEEDLRMIAEQSIKTDRQFAEITSLFHSLMQKQHSFRSGHRLDLGRSIPPERPATPRRTNLQYSTDILRAQSKKTDERFAEITEMLCSIMKKDQSESKNQGVDTRVLHSCNQDFHTARTLPPSIHHSVVQQDSSDRSTSINDCDGRAKEIADNIITARALHVDAGVLLELEANKSLEVVSPCPKKTISKTSEGNFITPKLEFVDWNSCAIENSLGLGNLVWSPLAVVDDGVLATQTKFLVMNNQWIHAQELFEKRSAEKLSTFGVCVELFDSVEHSYGSVDGSDSFVFDPGTSRVFSRYYHRLEGLHILIFDPGGSEIVSLVRAKCAASLCRAEAILSREANEIE